MWSEGPRQRLLEDKLGSQERHRVSWGQKALDERSSSARAPWELWDRWGHSRPAQLRPCRWDRNSSPEQRPTVVTFGSLPVPDEPPDWFRRNKVSCRRKFTATGRVGHSVRKDAGHSPHVDAREAA